MARIYYKYISSPENANHCAIELLQLLLVRQPVGLEDSTAVVVVTVS